MNREVLKNMKLMNKKNITKFKETEIGTIPEEWEVSIIPKIAKNFDKERKPLSSSERERMVGAYPYYGAAGIIDWVNNYIFDGKYLLVAEDGTVTDEKGHPTLQLTNGKFWVSNHAHILQCENFIETKFLYYALKNQNIRAFVTGAVQPKLNQENLNSIQLPYPTKEERYNICEILSSFDDKIELNYKINFNLEKLARSLFKKWFIDIGDELPEGWKIEKIGNLKLTITDYVANGSFATLKENVSKIYDTPEYALFVRNTDLKNKFTTKRYVDKKAYDFLTKTHLNGGEVIISNVADVGSVYKCPKFNIPMVLGNNVIMLNGNLLNNYLYLFFSSQIGQSMIQSITSGSAQLKFNKTDFRNLQILKPSNEILIKFDSVCEKIFQLIQDNQNEIENLIIIRDSLLSKLMNGKIRVK